MTTSEALKHWEQQISERKKNGIKVEDWCKAHGINRCQYYYWHSRIQKNSSKQPMQSIAFAEISPIILEDEISPVSNLISTPDFQILYKDIKVSVPSAFKPESLAGLMKVLHEL